jgi:hypothetical protein
MKTLRQHKNGDKQLFFIHNVTKHPFKGQKNIEEAKSNPLLRLFGR